MKKVFYALMVVVLAATMSSCVRIEGTGIMEVGVADETPTGLQQGNFLGSPLRYFTGIAKYFEANCNCMLARDTYTSCECMSYDSYTQREWGRVIKANVPAAVKAIDAELKQEYPYPSDEKITIRVVYYIPDRQDNPEVYDVQVPAEYYRDPIN